MTETVTRAGERRPAPARSPSRSVTRDVRARERGHRLRLPAPPSRVTLLAEGGARGERASGLSELGGEHLAERAERALAVRAVPPAREHGLEARVVADALRAQDVERPEGPGREREARRAIAEERARPAERAPDGGERAREVGGEFLRALPIEELVG